ncbi:MAG TPA: 50S ribosomal protein L11 methyltransferase [Solirubrobacteraceae bacterium]|nr:50S ribosomal protein L11 methyltransferase [Solirubrobacteraceae bacterium]
MIRLAIRLHRAQAEIGLAAVLGLAASGVEEVELADGSIEYAIYSAHAGLPDLSDLLADLGAAVIDVSESTVADDWADRWREFHQPSEVAGRLRIRAPWESPLADREDGPDVIEIVIEPAQAFGTGAHASTRLCLELLVSLEADGRARGRLVDIGCGSGVLGIAAAKLGWDPVVGTDHDPESVAATLENAAANGVSVEARLLDLRRDETPPAATMTANLLAPLLQDLAVRMTDPPVRLIAGGLLHDQVDAVTRAFADRQGLVELDRRHEGEWAAVLLGRDT